MRDSLQYSVGLNVILKWIINLHLSDFKCNMRMDIQNAIADSIVSGWTFASSVAWKPAGPVWLSNSDSSYSTDILGHAR